MKTIITTLNAKYIHTSLALRWLYVSNKDACDLDFREYTIKERLEAVADELLATGCDVLGMSVYIWNVSHIEQLVSILKRRKPDLILVVGGPEVTYEPEHFLNVWDIDYVISGEGEFVLGELVQCLERGGIPDIPGISSRGHISKVAVKADLDRLSKLPSPYLLERDRDNLGNRLVYFETSRGCPYQCQYCLSSREKGVRYFPMGYILENLGALIKAGARQIKFLDRTFNLNKLHTRAIFDFLIQNYRQGLSCQFEIYADLLTDEMIDYLNNSLPENYFRFEIGIQSTYEPTNIAVKRKQDFPLLADNIRKLMDGGKVVLHLDLIAGLPHETYARFVRSFNDVFALGGKEVQLGFLKMLRGTNLRRESEKYGYSYNEEAPYEINFNADISSEELHRIHEAEHALEKYWNSGRFTLTMHEIFTFYYKDRYFEFFDELGQYCVEQQFPARGYQLEDVFACLHRFLLNKGIDLFESLRRDYYANFTLRPPGFWDDALDKKTKKRLLYDIGQDKSFLRKHGLNRKMIEKQAAINLISGPTYLLTLFLNEGEKTLRKEIIYEF
ncbi:B12-binding domain-containing radical SAM protein [Bacteroides sp. 51]|uniref:B12-binding domain-containing radical SAM protein n=1 Tax=Bacteroides sp. 51 TaxID=2302938 RepID=UPI0013D8921B|nr:radical SAM protein [Bacteroides sp. 51]NDV81456.1 DUF4080 domain-containing protein [Bacteroides sp. 51]